MSSIEEGDVLHRLRLTLGVHQDPVPATQRDRGVAADNIFGRSAHYRGTQGTAIVRVFDKTAAMTGASEKALKRSKRRYRKVYVHPTNHAGYYPGAEGMTLKLLFDPETGKVLGARRGR